MERLSLYNNMPTPIKNVRPRLFLFGFFFVWFVTLTISQRGETNDPVQKWQPPRHVRDAGAENKVAAMTDGMLIVVLAAARSNSLRRLLYSLREVDYNGALVDIHISIDKPKDPEKSSLESTRVSFDFSWPHGRKSVLRRLAHVGLANSWFEAPISDVHEYFAIFEDDMQVSRHFYQFFNLLRVEGGLAGEDVTGLCLHPNDWEVYVEPTCEASQFSPFLYKSPEPCNWGPIWKRVEWQKYMNWVVDMKKIGSLPYVKQGVSYNYNKYLQDGKDVQSSWVWRYNYDFGKSQVRYSFVRCSKTALPRELFFVINHKEPGEHFKKKLDLENDPELLLFDFDGVLAKVSGERALLPARFPGYAVGAKSMRG